MAEKQELRNCKQCKGEFNPYPRRGREQVFCTPSCSDRFYNSQSRRIPLTLTKEQRSVIDSMLEIFIKANTAAKEQNGCQT